MKETKEKIKKGKLITPAGDKEVYLPATAVPSFRVGVKAPTPLPPPPEQRHLVEQIPREWKVSTRTWKRDLLKNVLKHGVRVGLPALSAYTTGTPAWGQTASMMLGDLPEQAGEWAGETYGFGAGLLHPHHPSRRCSGGYMPSTTRGLYTNPILPFPDHSYRW